MEHDHDIGIDLQRFVVAAFLVPAVAFVFLMLDDVFDAKLPGDFDGVVAAAVIHQDHIIHNIKRDFP